MKVSLQMVDEIIKCETDLTLNEIEVKINENGLLPVNIHGATIYYNCGYIQSLMIID